MKRFSILAAVLAGLLFLSGCTDISGRTLNGTELEEDDSYIPGIGGELLIVETEASEESQQQTQTLPQEVSSFEFSPQQESFISSCLFMGDSICSGVGVYGFAPECYAKAGVAARNILEFTFDYNGYQVGPLTTLVNSGAKNLVFLMGTNDVNMVSAEEYITYYDDFLSKVESACPDVSIYVISVPPVTADSTFCYNYELDELNARLKNMIESSTRSRHYIDASTLLKNKDGALRDIYSAGDSVHLTRSAYYVILYALCAGAGVV